MTEEQKEFEPQTPDKDLVVHDRRHHIVPDDSTNDPVVIALKTGADASLIERLMDAAERKLDLEQRQKDMISKEAFVKAVAEFKKVAPVVKTDKDNKHFGSRYASKGQIVNTIAPVMGEFGLTHRWEIEQTDKMIKVTCYLTHALGHSEKSSMEAPPDTSGGGSKNPIQQIKSTRTYLQVATFEDVTGTAAGADLDDDGNAAGKKHQEFISEKQVKEITKRLKKVYGDKTEMFLSWLNVETVDTIPAKDFNKAMDGIHRAEQAKADSEKREPGSDDE